MVKVQGNKVDAGWDVRVKRWGSQHGSRNGEQLGILNPSFTVLCLFVFSSCLTSSFCLLIHKLKVTNIWQDNILKYQLRFIPWSSSQPTHKAWPLANGPVTWIWAGSHHFCQKRVVSLCLNCSDKHHGLYRTPAFLLGVWDLGTCEAEGACLTSPQQDPSALIL